MYSFYFLPPPAILNTCENALPIPSYADASGCETEEAPVGYQIQSASKHMLWSIAQRN